MSKTCIPFSTGDISALARSLRDQLAQADGAPSHLAMLNMLARAAGYRNFQSLRAKAEQRTEPAVDVAQLQRLARYFDSQGRLKSWPAKSSLQTPCLWVMWSKLPAGESLSEQRLNQAIRALHLFGDHALIRRELCDREMLARTADGREYRRVEQAPSPEGLALIRHLSGGRAQ
jgi:hypothetical protein